MSYSLLCDRHQPTNPRPPCRSALGTMTDTSTRGCAASLRGPMRRLLHAALFASAAVSVAANLGPTQFSDDLILTTGLQPAVAVPAGPSRLSSNADGSPAPFRILILNNVTGQTPEVEGFIVNTLFPAAAQALSRSIRVRL